MRSSVYDAENKQTSVLDGSGTIGQYWYDGDGKRIKKYVPSTGETTVFVYDAAGKEIAEYSTVVANSTDAKVSYLTSDHLGSPRINTDQNGAVTARHDYMPFGEEIDGTGGRTTGLNYGDDTVRKQFTGYERDNETDLDYAKARYSNFSLGRFASPDPLIININPANPQGWNRYVYVLNSPLILVDPTGLIWGVNNGDVKWFDTEDALKEAGYMVFTPKDWTYRTPDGKWVTLNPDGPGSCDARYDCSNDYFVSGWVYSSDPSTRINDGGVQDVSFDFYLAIFGGGSVIKHGLSAVAEQVAARGAQKAAETFAGGITRTVIEKAAKDATGSTVKVVTNLTQSPQAGRTLSVAVGDSATALANAARTEGTTFTANIPKVLIETLKTAGLVEERTTLMGGVTGTEYLFRPEATEFVVRFFR